MQANGSNYWKEITTQTEYWLKFDSVNRKFYGIAGKSDIKKYQIRIDANNGYKST